ASRTVPARGSAPPPRPGRPGSRGPSEPPKRRTGATTALIVGGALILIIVAIVAVTQLGGSSDSATITTGGKTTSPTTANNPATTTPASVDRATTTVAVLNGTTTPGLAAEVADQIEKAGFARGITTNAADQQRAGTTVVYAKGFKAAAQQVAKIIGVASIAPIDASTQAIAGPGASVVVTVGADRTK
ncbi:MAG: LytR C-terminal domain-containing protein, partial [Solirubrobacterales bacterium]|nr:LytR C-terminal domain-containing protein [Solirubrobacterales bacterium]